MSKVVDINQTLTDIVQKHSDIPTLEERKSDSLDFHEVSVWQLEAMLKDAYAAGRRSGIQETAELAGKRILQLLEE